MYLGPPCYGYALNCHLVNLAIPKTRPLCMKKQILFYLYATAKSEKKCSNKHETGLVESIELMFCSVLLCSENWSNAETSV